MKNYTPGITLLLFLSLNLIANFSRAQSCTNWLKVTNPMDGVRIGDLDISGNQLTVEATINRTATYSGGRLYAGDIVSKHTGPMDCNYLLRPNSAEITTTAGTYYITPVTCDIQLNKTYHVAMTYDGSTLKFYRNGFLMSQVAASGNLYQNDLLTKIGDGASEIAGTPENMSGFINNVRIWNVARTQAQIQAYMSTPLPSPATQTGLLAYYTFDDLLNKQGNTTWNGVLRGNAQINQTNTTCTYLADSCAVNVTPVVPLFTAPDTVCIGTPVNITNSTSNATSYYWNFCTANLNASPTGVNMGNIGGQFTSPVYIDYVLDGTNYYGFATDNASGRLIRFDFGNSLLNTPTATNLGTLGSMVPSSAEGLQLIKNEGKWYVLIVGGDPTAGQTSKIVKVELGASITNNSPTVTDWGNIGNLNYPHDLYVFNDGNGLWYGLTVNTYNNSITRFNFTNSFSNTPTAVNLGNIGGLNGPTGLHAINDNGNWYCFTTNYLSNSLTRLDFGSSLLNTPTGTNLGNLGNTFHWCWDIYIIKYCGDLLGYVVNGQDGYNNLVKLNFNGNITNTPTATDLGNVGNLNFPHCLSKLFRVGADVYSFIPNARNQTFTRLNFAGCTNASTPSSTAQYPPAITYNTPGTYNINLTVDDGLATQSAACRQVVVMEQPTHVPTKTYSLCSASSIKIGSGTKYAHYTWSNGATTDSITVNTAGTYWVEADRFGCSVRDTIIITACIPSTALFTTPDTVCVNTPVAITNTSINASSYYWNFCTADLNVPPTGVNLGNIGGNLATPVFMDYVKVNGNYYGFLINHAPGGLIRLDFGNSLLNTPTSVNLGNFSGALPPASGSEGIQIVQNGLNWYAVIVADATVGGGSARLVTMDFGTNILNTTPAVYNWGNIGAMNQPIDLHVFQENNNWYGFTANAVNNTITRFNFGTSFTTAPTAVNFGNIGSLDYPTGIYAINDNGNWRVFITNSGSNTSNTTSLTRLDFGTSLLNTPTATNLGNPGGKLYHTRDITLMKYCGQVVGFAVNGDLTYKEIVKLNFNNDLTSTPTITSLGNIGNVSFPHSLSKLFRVNDNVYSFITNASNNTLTRLQFAGCTNASISSSTLQNPPAVTYNAPGTYNINLTTDDGLATQSAFCKQVVVLPALTHKATQTINICTGDSVKIGSNAPLATYSWNTGATTDSIWVKTPGTYWIQQDRYGCSNRDSFVVAATPAPVVNLGADTILCIAPNLVLDAGNPGSTYLWQDGSTAQTFSTNNVYGKFYVQVTNSTGCKASDTITVTAASQVTHDFHYKRDVCNPLAVQFISDGASLQNPYWDFGDGTTNTTDLSPTHVYTGYGNYTVRFGITLGTCTDTVTKVIPITLTQSNLILTPDTTICYNTTKQLRTTSALSFCWSPTTDLSSPTVANPITSTKQNRTYYFTAEVLGTNLITNGDFNNGNTGFTSQYTYTNPNTNEAQYYVGPSPQAWNNLMATCKDHTSGTGNMLLVNAASQPNTTVWTQTITVTPNTNYAFSTWLQNVNVNNTTSNPARLQFSINGNPIGSIFQSSYSACVWDQFYNTWNSGNATTATISVVNQNTAASGNDFALDDISFAPVSILYDSVIIKVDSPSVKTNNDTTICQGSSVQLVATSASASTWLWSPVTGLSASTISNPIATPAGNTQYIVTGTTLNGCVAKDTVNIKIDSIQADFHFKQDICNPLSVIFTGVGSSTLNPYWAFGDGNSTTGVTSTTHTYSAYGNYVVKYSVQNAGICRDTVTKAIPILVTPGNIILTPDTTICVNASKQLRTQPALSFCWTPTTYLSDPASANPVTTTPQNITYYFTAEMPGNNLIVNGDFSSGNTGFTSSYTSNASGGPEGVYLVSNNPQSWNGGFSRCVDHTTGVGNMMMVNGARTTNVNLWSQTVTVTPNTNYAFSTWLQSLTTANPAQLQFSINGNTVGNIFQASNTTCQWNQFYTTWNSGNNTSAVISIVNMNSAASGNDFALDDISFAQLNILRDSVIITVDTPLVKTINDTTICAGTSVPLTSTNKYSGGTWLWSPVAGLSGSTISNPIATPAANTQYIVTGTDMYGCVAKDTVNINLFTAPTVLTDHTIAACPNTPTQLSANSSFTSYSWSPAASLNNAAVYNPIATLTRDTKYTVTIKDANSCTYIDSVQVNVKDIWFAASPNTTICAGDTAVLTARGGDTYQWTPATTLSDPNAATTVASPTATTTYSVHIAENTCMQATTLNVTVGVNPSPVVTAQKSNDINCTIHTAKLTAAGALSYAWSPAINLDNANIPNPVAGADTTTTYYVMGTNEYGCTDTANVTIYVTSTGNINFLVPNAFTPNGDGHNDCFGVKNWGGAQLEEFQIFNRWGQRVFSTTNPNQCWDGRFGGQMADPGGYVYVIRAKTICGSIKRTGVFMLIR